MLAVVGVGCSEAGAPPPTITTANGTETATVAYVHDGDTLRTTSGSRIRLLQIDAPELQDECYGKAALTALRRLAPTGTLVTLVRDPQLDATDRYGRELRYVFIARRNVSVLLVREGAAAPYFFRKRRGRYARDLLAAADAARAAKRGFWGACPGTRLDPGIGSATGPA